MGSPLPGRLLNVFFNAEDWLGAGAATAGTLNLREVNSTGWTADFHGEIADLDPPA